MRKITSHIVNPANDKLSIDVLDEPGPGGASNHYAITGIGEGETFTECHLKFQKGEPSKVGTNGVTHETLVAILIDRLQGFQDGRYKCRENAIALDYLKQAQTWLQKRTRDRMARGVEGTHTV